MINATGVNTKATKANKRSRKRKGYSETPHPQVSVSPGFNFVTSVSDLVRQKHKSGDLEIAKSPNHPIRKCLDCL
jgi:hypothetical protein